MWLSEDYICKSVKDCGGRPEQVRVLSELNLCSPIDIENILKKHGFELVNGWWVDRRSFVDQSALYSWTKPGFDGSFAGALIKEDIRVMVDGGRNRMSKRFISDKVKEQIVEKYLQTGATYKDLAAEFGVSTWLVGDTIRKYLRDNVGTSTEDLVNELPPEPVEPAVQDISGVDTPDLETCLSLLDKTSQQAMYDSVQRSLSIKAVEYKNLLKLSQVLESLLADS